MPAINPLPTPPSRNDPANFSDRADAFLAALPAYTSEANALLDDVHTSRDTVQTLRNEVIAAGLESAAANAATATTKAAEASASASEAFGYLQAYRATSYGALAADPVVDPNGNPPTVGDEYFNTSMNLLKRFNGVTWQASDIATANLAAPGGSALVGADDGASGSLWTTVAGFIAFILSSLGASVIGFIQAGVGAVMRSVQSKLRETVSFDDFGVVGDGTTDDTAKAQNAINAAVGKRLIGNGAKTYLFKDQLTIPSNIEIDWQGATIIDDVRTFRPANQANRASPLFYMYGVNNIKLVNFAYESTGTRATVSNNVPTGIIWIGDNATTGAGPTFNIEVGNIKASNLANYSLFVGVVGESYNLHIHDIDISGNCSYGVNFEYGEAPSDTTDALAYGLHPHDVLVERFNGYNNPASVGFLRVASSYNIKFLNCYGKDVANFIYAWTGDRSISRVSENVKFENCVHYASSEFSPAAVNYCVQVLCANKDGSTGDPLPAWTNYDHLFTFENCEFQNTKFAQSAAVRFYGSQGNTVFKSCIFRDSYYGARCEPGANPSYVSFFSLAFRDCSFIGNSIDVQLLDIRGVVFDKCAFKNADGTFVPVSISSGAVHNKFLNCYFSGLGADKSYAVVAAGCGYNEFTGNNFANAGASASLELNDVTYGRDNVSVLLCRDGWAYFGLLGQPETLAASLADMPANAVNARRRTQYVALTGAVNKTLSQITGGKIGDEVIVQSMSSAATVTFTNLAGGVTTLERILCPGGANLTKTGALWTVRLKLNSVGWLLME